MNCKPKKLDYTCTSDEFRVAMQGCGVKVEISAEGNVTVYSNSGNRQSLTSPQTSASAEALKIGARMPDGTVFAGLSPDTGRPMYTTPKDAPLTRAFGEAADYAKELDAHGHEDWRVPTKDELNVLFQNRAAIGNFDRTGSYPAGWYMSSSRKFYNSAWVQRFSDGAQYNLQQYAPSALRCVRG